MLEEIKDLHVVENEFAAWRGFRAGPVERHLLKQTFQRFAKKGYETFEVDFLKRHENNRLTLPFILEKLAIIQFQISDEKQLHTESGRLLRATVVGLGFGNFMAFMEFLVGQSRINCSSEPTRSHIIATVQVLKHTFPEFGYKIIQKRLLQIAEKCRVKVNRELLVEIAEMIVQNTQTGFKTSRHAIIEHLSDRKFDLFSHGMCGYWRHSLQIERIEGPLRELRFKDRNADDLFDWSAEEEFIPYWNYPDYVYKYIVFYSETPWGGRYRLFYRIPSGDPGGGLRGGSPPAFYTLIVPKSMDPLTHRFISEDPKIMVEAYARVFPDYFESSKGRLEPWNRCPTFIECKFNWKYTRSRDYMKAFARRMGSIDS
jgi:hypothetical protein